MLRNSIKWSLYLMAVLTVISCKKEEEEDPNAPEACFDPPEELVAGVPLLFNASCSFNAQSFTWNFGDGGTSREAIPTYTYAEGGAYTVTLTVDNGEGLTDEVTLEIMVETPAIIEHSGNIVEDETWINAVHLITRDVHVDGATLTIEPGAVVMFAAGKRLYIGNHSNFSGATLKAVGTESDPITFTSAANTKGAGDWQFIGFYERASAQSEMKFCIVEYGGGYGENYGMIHIDGTSVAIENTTIQYSEYIGISLDDRGFFESFSDNELIENSTYPISIYGNFVHTIETGNNISGVNGIRVRTDHIEHSEVTWLEQTCAYLLEGTLHVGSASGAHLILEPGVEIRLGSGTEINVGQGDDFGTLTAVGTESKHIIFTSAAPEGSKSAGDWDYIGLYDGASGSTLTYCDIEYGGGYSSQYGMVYVNGAAINLTNSSLSNSESMGISFTYDAMFTACTDNTFEDNQIVPIEIFGNYAHTIGTGNTFLTGPGILVKADDIDQAEVTWLRHSIPYVVDGDLHLGTETGAKLTLEPGTTLKFTESSSLSIGDRGGTFGILVADGEPDALITFTSGAPEGYESAGDWDGIWFDNGTGNNTVLDNCIVAFGGGYGSNSGNLNVVNENPGVPSITNCQITNSGAWGIYVNNQSSASVTDVTYENNSSGDINQ
jgi:PKD repeat protein